MWSAAVFDPAFPARSTMASGSPGSVSRVYPEEAINGHRAFIARRRGLRPSEEYRTLTDQEWQEFLGHFEHRKVALGTCGRSYATPCIHEHSCLRCPLLRPDPAQRPRLLEVGDNLITRIEEARREGWLGEIERGPRKCRIEMSFDSMAKFPADRELIPDYLLFAIIPSR
jgi:hypothetical protein